MLPRSLNNKEHSRAKSLRLHLSLVQPSLELLLGHLEVLDVCRRTVQKRNFAGLLVRHGKDVLQTAVAIPELIATALLRLNALAANLLAALVRVEVGRQRGSKLFLLVIAAKVLLGGTALALALRRAVANGIEAMRVLRIAAAGRKAALDRCGRTRAGQGIGADLPAGRAG